MDVELPGQAEDEEDEVASENRGLGDNSIDKFKFQLTVHT